MKRIALVVQRCHPSIVGGSESLAWQYATLLQNHFQVDVLTTTALDYKTWANDLPIECETQGNIRIFRFEVTIERSAFWERLHERLLHDFHRSRSLSYWTTALQEEYIRQQGPHSTPLLEFLRDRHAEYEAVLFFTYLYSPTYFGAAQVPAEKVLIAPTLHDEAPAYFRVYGDMVHKARSLIWLTHAEQQFGQALWGKLPGKVIAMAIDTDLHPPTESNYPYILYCGRIDAGKGCAELIEFFTRFKKRYPSKLRLILTGQNHMVLPQREDVEFLGFVSATMKFQLMAGASVFVMPSPYESFSIVTLEAMAQGTPILVNGACQVLVEHAERSEGGKIYANYTSFEYHLKDLLLDPNQQERMGKLARQYVLQNYSFEQIQKNLIETIQYNT
ncbi:glycosyltransferase family 4 protein [Cyanobacteria bacterium FACHB-63]|nr:glycosyltransferase family 4 protein [Cyanobacteria bacterium FACHB-63]